MEVKLSIINYSFSCEVLIWWRSLGKVGNMTTSVYCCNPVALCFYLLGIKSNYICCALRYGWSGATEIFYLKNKLVSRSQWSTIICFRLRHRKHMGLGIGRQRFFFQEWYKHVLLLAWHLIPFASYFFQL